jgi:7-cyano-7-deazaguanine synthase
MSIVNLVSGGLDSTLMAVLTAEEGIEQFPLFINYGQLGQIQEIQACTNNFAKHELPVPEIINLQGYGAFFSSGLTDPRKRVLEDAFLPCRNLLFLTIAAAYAFDRGANAVGIGLLDDAFSIFPDQTRGFIRNAQEVLSMTLGRTVEIIAPLMSFSKADVVKLARSRGITATYSCHVGGPTPCGRCIACREYLGLEEG